MSLFSLRWIPLIAFIAAAGCGPLPRPFEPGSRDLANPLLQVQDSHGVVVAPIYDAPPEVATQLASLLAGGTEILDRDGVLIRDLLGWYKLEIRCWVVTSLSTGYPIGMAGILGDQAAPREIADLYGTPGRSS